MITFIRKWLTSWPVLILLGLLLVVFAFTGVGDPFGGGAPQGSVAKVGKRTITEPELTTAFDRAIRSARESNPALTQAQAAKEGGVAAVAGQLIGQTALEEFGRSIGLTASDRAVGGVIGGIPAFQSGGKFDEDTYRRVLAGQQMSDRDLRTSITGDIVRKQLLTPVTGTLGVPSGMAEPYARLLVDMHHGAVAMVPIAVDTAPPTEAEIASYYEANKLRFTIPERRGFRYAFIDRDAIAAGIKVSDADIAAAFAKDPAQYGAAATRKLQQVVVPDEAKAKAIAAAAATEGFAKAAERLAGFSAADIALGELSQPAFGKATSPEVAAAAFAAPIGGVTAPIKTPYGWHVVRAEANGTAGKTLEQARPAIAADLKARAVETAVSNLVARIEDGVDAGKSFADLAKENGLSITVQPPVTVAGATPGAAPLAGEALAITAKAFRHDQGDGASVEDLGKGRLVVVETMEVLPMAAQPLAAVRDLAIAGAAHAKAMAAARIKADAIVAQTKKTGDFKSAVMAQGLAAPQPLSGRRVDVAGQQQVPPLIQAFLATPARTVRVEPSPKGWVLINVDAIEPGNVAATPGLLDASRREIASQLPDEFARAFAAASERAVGVKRNDGVINTITRRLSGQDTGAQ